MTQEQQIAARINASYQELGISLEERVIAIEELLNDFLDKNKNAVAEKFKEIKLRHG